jgi:hypothetical protein
MAIDSAAKRRAIAGIIAGVTVVSVTPNGSQPIAWRQDAGWGYQGIETLAQAITPTDDDADTTVTARTDHDGTTIRPARVTIMHAVNSARNTDLTGPDRMPMDRYWSRSSRVGRLPNLGYTHRIFLQAGRAGDALAPRDLILLVSPSAPAARLSSADTTKRTDRDGTTMCVPTVYVQYAAESGRNADLRCVNTDQDRHRTRHQIPLADRRGGVHRFFLHADGRAGTVFAPRDLYLEVVPSGDGRVRAEAT